MQTPSAEPEVDGIVERKHVRLYFIHSIAKLKCFIKLNVLLNLRVSTEFLRT